MVHVFSNSLPVAARRLSSPVTQVEIDECCRVCQRLLTPLKSNTNKIHPQTGNFSLPTIASPALIPGNSDRGSQMLSNLSTSANSRKIKYEQNSSPTENFSSTAIASTERIQPEAATRRRTAKKNGSEATPVATQNSTAAWIETSYRNPIAALPRNQKIP